MNLNFYADLWKKCSNVYLDNFFKWFVHLRPDIFQCKYTNSQRNLQVSYNLFVINIFFLVWFSIFLYFMVYITVSLGDIRRKKKVHQFSIVWEVYDQFYGHKQSSVVLQNGPPRLPPGGRGISRLCGGNAQEARRGWIKLHQGKYYFQFKKNIAENENFLFMKDKVKRLLLKT